MEYNISPYQKADKPHLIAVFNHYVDKSFAAFNISRVPEDYLDIFFEQNPYPVYSIEYLAEKKAIGFGLIRPHHRAESFKYTGELTYFISPEHTRKGLGKRLLQKLLDDAREHKLKTLMACISSLNRDSLLFHLKNGFTECGRFREVGNKFGRSFDLIWMQLFV
jgi:L-amino acid N-acyltransferase YncA